MRFFINLFTLITFSLSLQAQSLILPGDRIAIIGNTLADQLRTHGYLETLLIEMTQPNSIALRNLAWAGDTITKRDRPTNFPSEELTLKNFKADVILAFFGFGESFQGKAGLATFEADLKEFIKQYQGKVYHTKPVRLIFVSPIAYENLGELSPKLQQRNQELELYTNAMAKVMKSENIDFIDLYHPTKALMETQHQQKFTNNGIHLNPYGYWAMSRILVEKLYQKKQSWNITAQAKSSSKQKVLELDVEESGWPSLAPPTKHNVHDDLNSYRDQLKIEHLEPGDYTLTIDGTPVTSGSHREWAEGKVIDQSPLHHELNEFRKKVQDKNQQFVYGWKAVNQVHIVGERRSSPSGKKLPSELIRFYEITDQKQRQLKNGLPKKQRQYRLIPQISESLLQ